MARIGNIDQDIGQTFNFKKSLNYQKALNNEDFEPGVQYEVSNALKYLKDVYRSCEDKIKDNARSDQDVGESNLKYSVKVRDKL